jgi:cell division septation protein DedD
VRDGAADFWYPFRWTGFRPRDAALDKPVEFAGRTDSAHAVPDSGAKPADSAAAAAALPHDSAAHKSPGFTVSFAALLVPEKARELAAQITVGNERARVITAMRDGAAIYRVVLGPYATREEADRVGHESKQSYWVYEGGP